MIDLSGRVVLITGAGGGLGRAHALLAARHGARVAVNDLDAAMAQAVADEIAGEGGTAMAVAASVADAAAVDAMVAQIAGHWGRIDGLVNNAGILRDRTFGKLDMNDWDAVVKVHLSGTAYVTRAAWPLMQEQRYGRVVFTTSNSGLYGNFGQSNYSAAKMGMVGLMNTLKQEGGKYNIRVNTIAPVAMTGMTEGVMPADIAPHFKPEHVSAAVALLCSEAFEESGVICSAAAGHYATVRVACTSGVQLDPAEIASPEDLLARWGEISDEGRMRAFPNAGAETIAILEDIQQLAVS